METLTWRVGDGGAEGMREGGREAQEGRREDGNGKEKEGRLKWRDRGEAEGKRWKEEETK